MASILCDSSRSPRCATWPPGHSALSPNQPVCHLVGVRRRPFTCVVALGGVGLLVAGSASCGTANDEGARSPAAAPAQQATTTVSTTPTTPTTPATPTTTATPTTLPGESFDIGPSAGAVLGVVGVPFDGVLEVLALPEKVRMS